MSSPAGVGPTTERTLFLLQAVLKQGSLKFQALPKAWLQGNPANPLRTVSRSFLPFFFFFTGITSCSKMINKMGVFHFQVRIFMVSGLKSANNAL